MKTLLATAAGVALLAMAGPVSAQTYQPTNPAQMPQMQSPPMYQPTQSPMYQTGAPSWMRNDGSSSDYPVPMPGDRSGSRLNAQYRNGIDVPPGTGLPASPGQE
jgi:hypothetical protein